MNSMPQEVLRSPVRRRIESVVTPAALFLFALAVRTFSYRTVIGADEFYPRGNDSFYHLRRIAYGVANFPAMLDFDRYINFPAGARPLCTPLMDGLRPVLAWPFAGGLGANHLASVGTLEAVAVWAPPVLGALTVVLLYATIRPRLGRAVAIAAGSILCLLPAHAWYSQLGFVDHHVLVAAVSWIALIASMRWLERDTSATEHSPCWAAAGAGATFALAILVWPGCVYHVALLEIGMLIYLSSRTERSSAIRFALQFALANAVGLTLVLPFTIHSSWEQWPPFSPVVLSEFQPWFFGVLSVYGVLCAGIWRSARLDFARRWISGLLLGLTLLIGSLAMIAGLREGGLEALRWLTRTEGFQAQVLESVPLLISGDHFSIDWALRYLSAFVLLFPLALAAAALLAWRCRRDRSSLLLLLWFTSGLFGAALLQRRFANSFSLPLALLMAWACSSLGRSLRSRMSGRPCARPISLLVACALAGLLLEPTAHFYERSLRLELARLRGQSGAVPAQVIRHRRMAELALFLRDHTPPTSGWLDASIEPEYAVLGDWSIGHRIEYLARRPTITDAFGDDIGRDNFRLAQEYFTLAEPQAVALLQKLHVRYVVVERESPLMKTRFRPASMYRSLYFRDGSERAKRRGHARDYPALEQHRLIFETEPTPLTGAEGPAAFKVFEYVRGAVVSGRASPGAPIHLALRLRSNRGRLITYTASVTASGSGEFAIRVPYATTGNPGLSKIEGSYTIRCGDRAIAVSIDEAAVR